MCYRKVGMNSGWKLTIVMLAVDELETLKYNFNIHFRYEDLRFDELKNGVCSFSTQQMYTTITVCIIY